MWDVNFDCLQSTKPGAVWDIIKQFIKCLIKCQWALSVIFQVNIVAFAQSSCLYMTLQSQQLKCHALNEFIHCWFYVAVFIRRHLILIKGKEGAAVGREVETIQHMFLTSREETRQLCINGRRSCVSGHQSSSPKAEIIHLTCQRHCQEFWFDYRAGNVKGAVDWC